MSDATHDPRAWRVATALAHATGLDWARWAMGETAPVMMCECGGPWRGSAGWRCICGRRHPVHRLLPVPAPWDTEAYLADCRRRGVEPGPPPSLKHSEPGVEWQVFHRVTAHIVVGNVVIEVIDAQTVDLDGSYGKTSIDDLVRATNLARVAAEVYRPTVCAFDRNEVKT